MTQRLHDPSHLQARQTTRDQLAMIKAAHQGEVAWNSQDAADADYSFVPGRLLWSKQDQELVSDAMRRRSDVFAGIGALRKDPKATRVANIVVRRLPRRRKRGGADRRLKYRDHGDPALEATLEIFDDELGEGVVTPDHYLHVANGDGKHCPATEPEETGLKAPWPPLTQQLNDGKDVRVAVIDTGWHPRAAQVRATAYLRPGVGAASAADRETYTANDLAEYAGHGTFIAGVIRCRAPMATIKHYLIGQGGAVTETDMVAAIYRALEDPAGPPHIVNLSAGCHTRLNHGLKTFHRLWLDKLWNHPETVLIAAAGNDASNLPFHPAARGWAVGVGSLDHADPCPVSSFSNYGVSSDVYVLGRNHVNAFPKGHYVCKEAPNVGDVREFTNGLARWSGTSFAAPLFAGLVAARLSRSPGRTATDVAWELVDTSPDRPDAVHGRHHYIHIPDGSWRHHY